MSDEDDRSWGAQAQRFYGGARSVFLAFVCGIAVSVFAVTLWQLPDRVEALETQQEMTSRVLLAVRVEMCYETNGDPDEPGPTIRYLLRCNGLVQDIRERPVPMPEMPPPGSDGGTHGQRR